MIETKSCKFVGDGAEVQKRGKPRGYITAMNTRELTATLTTLFGELLDGPSGQSAHMLNRGDVGLLRSLDKLTARQASLSSSGGASIAAHVDHLRYGLSLLNRWSRGENPFETADWTVSWRITTVTEEEWSRLRTELRAEAHRWAAAIGEPRDVLPTELADMIGSVAHLAYHLGAIRQIDRATRGPAEPLRTH